MGNPPLPGKSQNLSPFPGEKSPLLPNTNILGLIPHLSLENLTKNPLPTLDSFPIIG